MNRSAIITLVERVTRYTVLGHLPGRHNAAAVSAVLHSTFSQIPAAMRRTLTWDRGNEMALWNELERAFGVAVYFCDPHSPWQRPTNEHTNRQLRFWFPKGHDLTTFSPAHLGRVADILNDHPRRLLGWATPSELYAQATVH